MIFTFYSAYEEKTVRLENWFLLFSTKMGSPRSILAFLFFFFFYLRQSSSLLNYIYICIIPLSLFLRIFRKRNSFRDEEILPS